ncbi:acyl-CoA synthetase [Aestuariicella hydrocarbonica]|uniref:Acyl-CoA synthetase n=1 Tax=Pseudomaricurvus hydrocarbonicus TaxID=1470433 RepID=A0A9E5MIU3_9GAMM|nr:acyl-CoA synthetase [Aestuariicella hydrocarbonica]NHO64029.1 acyl-CoA synthetase [Aestuariicella hydrocarbonica]
MNAALPQGPAASEMHSLKVIEQFEKSPLSQRYPWTNSYDLILNACEKWGDDTGLEFVPTGTAGEPSEVISYRQLARRITQTANLLHSLGVQSQDAVSVMMPSLPETYYAIWGAQAAGITSPLNPMLDAHHLAEIIDVTQSKVLITTAPFTANRDLWEKAVEVVKQATNITHMVIITRPGLTEALPSAPREGVIMVDYNAIVDNFNDSRLDSGRRFHGDDAAAYMHTGGTTGRPKVAQLNHSNFAFVAQLIADMGSDQPRYNTPCALPLFHIFGLVVTGIAAFSIGNPIIILSPSGFRNPNVVANFWSYVERFKFKGVAAVPTILSVLYEVPVGDHDVSSLEEIISGAAPLPDHLKLKFEDRYHCRVRNGYGMTETTALLSLSQKETPVPLGSCGLRLPYAERIIGHIDGNKLTKICGPNEAGVILTRGPNVFAGYLEKSDNDKAWVDNWYNTGDIGYLDEEGFLFLTGRAKDLIIRGGHNIDPLQIEEPLLNHPDVADVVAIGQPDAHAGELPIAYVVAKPGKHIDEQALLAYCQKHISERAAIPKRIQLLESIPLTAVGKVFKPRLREMAAEYVLHSILTHTEIGANIAVYTDQLKGLTATITLDDKDQAETVASAVQSLPFHIDIV